MRLLCEHCFTEVIKDGAVYRSILKFIQEWEKVSPKDHNKEEANKKESTTKKAQQVMKH